MNKEQQDEENNLIKINLNKSRLTKFKQTYTLLSFISEMKDFPLNLFPLIVHLIKIDDRITQTTNIDRFLSFIENIY